jgi:phage shock protein A
MGWLERMERAVRAQINSLINEAEDPEKILETAVLDMEQESIEMRRALAEAIATQKSNERVIANYQQSAQKCYERARVAMEKGNEAQAREALNQRQSYQQQAHLLQTQLEQQGELAKKLKKELLNLEHKYIEAKAKKNLYIARVRAALATQRLHEINGNLHGKSSLSVFEQLETKILEIEAESELMGASAPDGLEEKFAELEGGDRVDVELAKIRSKQQSS